MSWIDVIEALDLVSNALITNGNQQAFSDHWSLQGMPVTPKQLALPFEILRDKINVASLTVDDNDVRVAMILKMLQSLRSLHVGNLLNAQTTHQIIVDTYVVIDAYLTNMIGTEGYSKVIGLPRNFSSRIKTASTHLDSTLENLQDIDKKIEAIRDAHDSAADLPLTLKDLDDARAKLNSALIHFSAKSVELERIMANATTAIEKIEVQSSHADDLSGRIDGSYRAITSQGLAQAFHVKEKSLRTSTYVWTFFLFCSLSAMGMIGYLRFPEILASLSGSPTWTVVLIELALAALSLGAPTWFAIVSTRQIGQRFKLAEDYGYKAAVSAAYEGYRSEASRFGEEFQTRLFSSTLDRLDEQPLRFIDNEVGGSPAHEILSSLSKLIDMKAAKEFAESIPSIIERWKKSSVKEKGEEKEKGKDDESSN